MFEEATEPVDRTKQRAKALSFLLEKVNEIGNPFLRKCCLDIVNSEEFQTCTASRKQHQAYEGGLLVHTAETLEIALGIAATRCLQIDVDILTVATVYHDIGKIYDYVVKEDGSFEYTEHQKLVRHLPRSYAIFMNNVEANISDELQTQIGHCILSHHGRFEWGTPVLPQTPEAYALHCADWMSANCTEDHWE